MKNRLLLDWVLILIIYAACVALVLVASTKDVNLPVQLGVKAGGKEEAFLEDFQTWAIMACGVSFLATFFWYVIGAWGPKPHSTRQSSWMVFWLIGLVLAVGGGLAAYLWGPEPADGKAMLGLFYIATAVIFYYLATLLFSPVNVKYVVPGSKLFRRW